MFAMGRKRRRAWDLKTDVQRPRSGENRRCRSERRRGGACHPGRSEAESRDGAPATAAASRKSQCDCPVDGSAPRWILNLSPGSPLTQRPEDPSVRASVPDRRFAPSGMRNPKTFAVAHTTDIDPGVLYDGLMTVRRRPTCPNSPVQVSGALEIKRTIRTLRTAICRFRPGEKTGQRPNTSTPISPSVVSHARFMPWLL